MEASPNRHCVLQGPRSPSDCQAPPATPARGVGPWSLSLGLPGRGAPLPAPLERTPAPRSSALLGLPHPFTPSFWGTGKCPIIVTTREDTKALGPSGLTTSSGALSSCSSPRPHLPSWSEPVPCRHAPPWCTSLPSAARAPSPCALSCHALGRPTTFPQPSPPPLAQAAAGQAHGSVCMKWRLSIQGGLHLIPSLSAWRWGLLGRGSSFRAVEFCHRLAGRGRFSPRAQHPGPTWHLEVTPAYVAGSHRAGHHSRV